MDDKPQVKTPPERAEGKAEWVRPDVDRFAAGAAEGSADIAIDGLDIPS